MDSSDRRVAIVVDSGAYLPAGLAEEHDIHVVPLILMMGGKTWRDGVDIDAATFYELLRSSSDFPTTSQPSVGIFRDLFVELSKEAEGIVAVLVTSKLSGTVASAQAAAAELPEVPTEIIDSGGISMMLGYPAVEAARAAAAGGDIHKVASAAREVVEKTNLYGVVGTLEYLHRGGRIGGAAKFFGSVLDLKPILEFREGVLEAATKVRTRAKAWRTVYELLDERIADADRFHLSVINAGAPEEAARFKEGLLARFSPVEVMETELSPAIGSHTGPGTVGVVYYVE